MKPYKAIWADGIRYEFARDAAEATGISENTLYTWPSKHPGPPSPFYIKGHEFLFEAADQPPVKTKEPEASYSLPAYVRDAIAEIYTEFDGRCKALVEQNKTLRARVKTLEQVVKIEA
jgi:hypothetical protein